MVETIFHQKIVRQNGDIVEMRIISVPQSIFHPEGVRYALVYIRKGHRVVGYDNHEHKGHHKHTLGKEAVYGFKDIDLLIEDFRKDVKIYVGEEL